VGEELRDTFTIICKARRPCGLGCHIFGNSLDGPPDGSALDTVTVDTRRRLFAVADATNGIGFRPDITGWTFLNTDLAVHIFQVPDGEWIGIRAETNYGPDGIGTTVGTLFDEGGAVGNIQQSVLVRRPPS
jgi:hypothetical protein